MFCKYLLQENDPSIILDASKYIEELKHKVQILNQDISSGQSSSYQNSGPVVCVFMNMHMHMFTTNIYCNQWWPHLVPVTIVYFVAFAFMKRL